LVNSIFRIIERERRKIKMGKLDWEGSADAKKLTAAGVLTIQDASALKGLLMKAYDSGGDLLIDLTEAQSMDLAFIQVLCSANITFRKAGRLISIGKVLPEGVRKSLHAIALEPGSCDLETPAQCLWMVGG
jgi:anti-anti-sigma regulatory factor